MLETESYAAQAARWPQSGRHILAQFDAHRVVVYQAFRPKIAHFAAANGFFGGAFSLSRMSWVKPNFLWMMFRCGWATKEDQETVVAVSLRRDAFDAILAGAVPSSYDAARYGTEAAWKDAAAVSQVRMQWDPDHDPAGGKVGRRAVQLGLRGDFLARYAREWVVSIEDVTPFVIEQRRHAQAGDWGALVTPREEVYPVGERLAAQIGVTL